MMIVCINAVFARIFKKANIEVKSMNKIIQKEMILLSRLFDTMHGPEIQKAILEGKLAR
jgi:hypothetical protein